MATAIKATIVPRTIFRVNINPISPNLKLIILKKDFISKI